MNLLPLPWLLSIEMRPPCASTMSLTIASPIPVESGSYPDTLYCAKGSKT